MVYGQYHLELTSDLRHMVIVCQSAETYIVLYIMHNKEISVDNLHILHQ